MKLFKKNHPKKPLTDKAKAERKEKRKKIIKRVLDILVYGFAIFMIFGFLIGSCNQKPKTGNAYFYGGENNYTDVPSVLVNEDSVTNLYHRYDINSTKTFPLWDTYRPYMASPNSYWEVELVSPFVVDTYSYEYLRLSSSSSPVVYTMSLRGSTYSLDFSTISSSGITFTNQEHLVRFFNGSYYVKPIFEGTAIIRDHSKIFFQWLTYYFGSQGFNNVNYVFPQQISNLGYLFTSGIDYYGNNYIFVNDDFPTVTSGGEGITTSSVIFTGSFKANGVYYRNMTVNFSSVYGTVNGIEIHYTFPNIDGYISSTNEDYINYWYIDSIFFGGYNISAKVYWSGTLYNHLTENFYRYEFGDNWAMKTYLKDSPFTNIFIYYGLDMPYSFDDAAFPLLSHYSYASFLLFIGDGYTLDYYKVEPSSDNATFTTIFEWLRQALYGTMPLLGYTLIPGITLGTLLLIPLAMSIILFVVKLFKR